MGPGQKFSLVSLLALNVACGATSGDSETPNTEPPPRVDAIAGFPVTFREELNLSDVEFAGDQFVAVGIDGPLEITTQPGYDVGARSLVLTSSDGRTWKKRWVGDAGPIQDVAFRDGRWLAVGRGAWAPPNAETVRSAIALVSDDGTAWRLAKLPPGDSLGSVVASGAGFIGVSDGLAWLTVSGSEWASRALPFSESGNRLVTSRNVLLVHGFRNLIARSADAGQTWTVVEPPGELGSDAFQDSVRGIWPTAEGFAGTSQYGGRWKNDLTSADGATWTKVRRAGDDLQVGPLQVLSVDGVEVRRTDLDQVEVRTADGAWVSTLAERIHALAHAKGVFVAVGVKSLYYSVDAWTWQRGTVED